MLIDNITHYKTKYEATYNHNAAITASKKVSVSEAFALDDYEKAGFNGYDNESRPEHEIRQWAEKTKDLAEKSLFFYMLEIPLKIASYFTSENDNESMWAKGAFSLERLSGILGSTFRHQIYNLPGDNLEAESFAKTEYGDKSTSLLGKVNYFIQTKLRFAFPILGLFNKSLANDLDWFISDTFESAWWRNMGLNNGFFPGFTQHSITRFLKAIPGLSKLVKDIGSPNEQKDTISNEPIYKYLQDKTMAHYKKAKELWKDYKSKPKDSTEKQNSLLTFSKEMDMLTSAAGILQIPINFFGDTIRPLARRFGVEGATRAIIRTLSVADRAVAGANYIFKFLIPTLHLEKLIPRQGPFRASNLYMFSLAGDVLDLPLSLFEGYIKQSNPFVKHGVEVFRILKNTSFNGFLSQRRKLIADKKLNELSQES